MVDGKRRTESKKVEKGQENCMYDGVDGAWIECRLFECFCLRLVAPMTPKSGSFNPVNPRIPSNYRPCIVILRLFGHSRALD